MIERAGARVLIDPVSLDFLAGSEIDFVDDLIGASFKVNNPQGHRLLRLRHQLLDLSRTRSEPGALARPSILRLPLPRMKIATWNINGVKARLESAIA